MPRKRRMVMVNSFEPTIYHVMSRTALDGYPLTDVDKDYLVELIRKRGQVFF